MQIKPKRSKQRSKKPKIFKDAILYYATIVLLEHTWVNILGLIYFCK